MKEGYCIKEREKKAQREIYSQKDRERKERDREIEREVYVMRNKDKKKKVEK